MFVGNIFIEELVYIHNINTLYSDVNSDVYRCLLMYMFYSNLLRNTNFLLCSHRIN